MAAPFFYSPLQTLSKQPCRVQDKVIPRLHSQFGSPKEQNESCTHTSVTFASPQLPKAGPPLLHPAGREGRSRAASCLLHFLPCCHTLLPAASPRQPFPSCPFKCFERTFCFKFLHRNHCLMFRQNAGGEVGESQAVSNKGESAGLSTWLSTVLGLFTISSSICRSDSSETNRRQQRSGSTCYYYPESRGKKFIMLSSPLILTLTKATLYM